MAETLEKLRPDRDFQCYFERPSAIAALSQTSPTGFTVSGTWRQQFDWVVVEWNRDNVFEHPALRNLPDGDLSGLTVSYEETRENCIALDSNLFPTVDWPYLRIWAQTGGVENLYKVPLKKYATAIGTYQPASATFELQGSPTTGDYVELAWSSEHYTYQMRDGDILENALDAMVAAINAPGSSSVMIASRTGRQITLQYVGVGRTVADSKTGASGNRVGIYGNVSGPGITESWQPAWQRMSGGLSPAKWRIDLNFAALQDEHDVAVPANSVRKLRWTYSAELQAGAYQRSEFEIKVSNWTVTGSNRGYRVAGQGSRRIQDDSPDLTYTGAWTSSRGNFSGGSIHQTSNPGDSVTLTYRAQQNHDLYLGTRRAPTGAQVSIAVDDNPVRTENLETPLDDVLVRILVGSLAGPAFHTIKVTHSGASGTYFYFDFLEIAIPAAGLPVFPSDTKVTLATDWDTDHSIALAPERTAWLMTSLGFLGRANHYAGALWFYELYRQNHIYASASVQFLGPPPANGITELSIGVINPVNPPTVIQHLNLVGDTAVSVAKAFELELNSGYTGVWAQASGNVLTIYARAMGLTGNDITIAASPTTGAFVAQVSGPTLTGGANGEWRTDLTATPRINRAARDWSRSFYRALASYDIDVAAAFSMELQHGDPAPAAGIAQRYPGGGAVELNTPALQTNFSPASLGFWKQVYLDMATVMSEAGVVPYLQFGEVQWWYFPDITGMPFYDSYTANTFAATYGRPLHVFATSEVSPALYPEEAQFLPSLIGTFTNAIMTFVRGTFPAARFEVLYPHDVNNTALNRVINLPVDWSPARLDCLKTENFIYTGGRNLNQCKSSIRLPIDLGFTPAKSSHLVGIGDYTTPWEKETRLSKAEGVESVVLFALDQFCLIGYPVPLRGGTRRSRYMG